VESEDQSGNCRSGQSGRRTGGEWMKRGERRWRNIWSSPLFFSHLSIAEEGSE
jgi:hypothetical protein